MDACSEKTMATGDKAEAGTTMSRKEKRKLLKKEKRKQLRKEIAVREKEADEARLNDSEEQSKLRQLEQEELDRMERDRREFEERERRFLEELELNRKREQEEYKQEQERERERQKLVEEYRAKQVEDENPKEMDEGSDWEYAEEGPAEIIWQGNEIIVKKKRVRVPKKNLEQQNKNKDVVRPISNPLAPHSEAFEDCKSAQQILDTVAQQVPNFGTEQDKAHCPFHLKTGACRFGTRCSRVHFYPDKSCTLLMKNMYGGPGLTWEQDEGLEHTDEETERSFEEFYEDVHTEILKFGEIVNFKVCRNGSPHLRGNVYVHYKSLESAVLAYQSTNGRYFAGKQVVCEFVNLTRWKVAICGEYMRSRLKTCSRGSTCNFIHCFRNPCGDYEWADWDRPPPRYWINKMTALFGYEDGYDKLLDKVSPDKARSAAKSIRTDADSRRYSRSRSRELDSRHSASYYYDDDDNDYRKSKGRQWRHMGQERENSLKRERNEVKMRGKDNHYIRGTSPNVYSDDDQSDKELRRINHEGQYAHKKGCRRSQWRSRDRNSKSNSDSDISVKEGRHRYREDYRSHRSKRHSNGKSTESDSDKERSVKDGSERYHEDRTSSRQKTKDSLKIDYERDSREETHQNDPEGRYHEDNIHKHHKYRSKSTKLQDDDLDSCCLDSHGDTMVNNEEGYDVKRRRSSRWSNSELDWPGHDSAGDGFDRNENEYWRHRKESSNTETVSKKSDLSEHFHGSHRDKHGKRESSKHKKRERRPPKSERRSCRHRRKDRAGSNVTLSQKEEASERTHKHRKESASDQSKFEDELLTSHEGHHEREACEERFQDAEFDEGNGTFYQKPMDGEKNGDGNFSRQEDSVVLEFVNEQACRHAALEKMQEKQLQKQPTPITSSHNVEGSVTISKVHEDHNDVEAEPRKRRRI